MPIRSKSLDSRGDTIVEVLLVLAILSMAFVMSYTTATASLTKARNAQEHSKALGILNGQMDQLRSAISRQLVLPPNGQHFCFNPSAPTTPVVSMVAPPNTNTLTGFNALCSIGTAEPIYKVHIVYDSTHRSYAAQILWQGVSGLGVQQETMHYRISTLTNFGSYTEP